MSIFGTNENKSIYMRQGDTGNIIISGIPKDKAYSVYMSIYNLDENTIIAEKLATTFTQSTGIAIFTYDETFSNALPVGDWAWGLKICAADGSEDTLVPRTTIVNGKIVPGTYPAFTVDYKVTEGA